MSRRKRKPKYWCKRVRCECKELVDPRGMGMHRAGQKHLEKMMIDNKVTVRVSPTTYPTEVLTNPPEQKCCLQHEWTIDGMHARTLTLVCQVCKARATLKAHW